MTTTKLQDDLLKEFGEERKLINEQIKLFDPLAVSLRKPAAQRLLNKTMNIFFEIVLYLLALTGIAFIIFMNKLYPFYLLDQIKNRKEITDQLGIHNTQVLYWSICALAGISVILLLIMARMLGRIRQKNAILNMAGAQIKTLVGQHLNRKAAIDAIEQRHFMELPVVPPAPKVNDIPNPGYDD